MILVFRPHRAEDLDVAVVSPALLTRKLSDLPIGARARVISVRCAGVAGSRLAAMGLIPNTVISVRRSAPLRDPREYELRGYRLCLRKQQAAEIDVVVL